MKKWVKVRVPASTSNLGPGFDVLGLALDLYNEIDASYDRSWKGVSIEIEGFGKDSLARDKRNLIWKAMEKVLSKARAPKEGYRIRALNRIPLARGLGSSAAATLGGILAGNALAGDPLSEEDVLELAVKMEGHPDNVAPQLKGGFCISSRIGGELEIVRLTPPKGIVAVVCVPDFELSTKKARAVLPKSVPHRDAVANAGRVALFLGKFFSGDLKDLKTAMEDRLHQPYRKHLIPGFDRVVAGAYRAGALGAALSGAGPSIFAFASPSKAARVGKAMEKGFASAGVKAESRVLKFNLKGSGVSAR